MEENKAENMEKNETKKAKPWLKIAAGALALVLLGGSSFAALYFYQKYKKAASGSDAAATNEIKSITDKIEKFMELPDETPTLATVADKEKLSGQSFFTKAQNGDKVLIFTQSHKAILYRPESGKIIEVVSLVAQNEESVPTTGGSAIQSVEESPSGEAMPAEDRNQEVSQPPEQPVIIKVAVYNGTDIKGLAKDTADKILGLENTEITEMINARGIYEKTLVVNLSGVSGETVDKIAEAVNGEKRELPAGETKPDADILVIGGKQ